MKTAVLATILAAAACTTTPDVPTWQTDVMPVLASNCVRCHGRPAEFGAPPSFRLDVWEDTPDVDHPGLTIRGAGTMAFRAYDRVHDGTMPPEFPTVGDAAGLLLAWSKTSIDATAATDTPKTPAAIGAPRAGNRPPTIAVTPGAAAGDFDYEIDDADFDVVYGVVVVNDADAAPPRFLAYDLHAGRGTFHVDTAALGPGTFGLEAFLDDGSAPIDTRALTKRDVGAIAQPIGSLTVAAGVAPTIVLNRPRPFELIANGTLTIDATVTDPDGPIASAQLQLFELGNSKQPPIVLPLDPTQPLPSLDVSALAGDDWVLAFTATDPEGHSTTVRSTQLVFGHADPTGQSYATVKDLLKTSCTDCHNPCGSTFTVPGMRHDWTGPTTPAACLATSDGVSDGNNPGLIYDRVFRKRDMPPRDWPYPLANPELLKTYLLAGAPP